MIKLFKKDSLKRMEKKYLDTLEDAMQFQRKGDMKRYALKMAAAEDLQKRMEEEKKKHA